MTKDQRTRKDKQKNFAINKRHKYKSSKEKKEIRIKNVAKIPDNSTILILESSEYKVLKQLIKQGITPKRIIIPNNKESESVMQKKLKKYKRELNIEYYNMSAKEFLRTTTDKFDYVWLDYCGSFTAYRRDLDILIEKCVKKKCIIILTYNTFDPNKYHSNYYFTEPISYFLELTKIKYEVSLLNDITYRYKSNMYNLGFSIIERRVNKKW